MHGLRIYIPKQRCAAWHPKMLLLYLFHLSHTTYMLSRTYRPVNAFAREHDADCQILIAIVAMVIVHVAGTAVAAVTADEAVAMTVVVRSLWGRPNGSPESDASPSCLSSPSTPQTCSRLPIRPRKKYCFSPMGTRQLTATEEFTPPRCAVASRKGIVSCAAEQRDVLQ